MEPTIHHAAHGALISLAGRGSQAERLAQARARLGFAIGFEDTPEAVRRALKLLELMPDETDLGELAQQITMCIQVIHEAFGVNAYVKLMSQEFCKQGGHSGN